MKRVAFALLLACASLAIAEAPRIKRSAMETLERTFDQMLATSPEPCELLGNTRGIYLDNYGAVFTALANLVYTPTPNPFRPAISPAEIHTLHERKSRKVTALEGQMKQMLVNMAASSALDSVRPTEQIVCGVSLFYYSWEDVKGLPSQIVVQGEKQKLLEIQTGRAPKTELDNVVKVQKL